MAPAPAIDGDLDGGLSGGNELLGHVLGRFVDLHAVLFEQPTIADKDVAGFLTGSVGRQRSGDTESGFRRKALGGWDDHPAVLGFTNDQPGQHMFAGPFG